MFHPIQLRDTLPRHASSPSSHPPPITRVYSLPTGIAENLQTRFYGIPAERRIAGMGPPEQQRPPFPQGED
eukprot:1394753-Amorphochlora_amoeboformis.AAC.1